MINFCATKIYIMKKKDPIYRVDEPKRHHASRKSFGGESIPALGFYGFASLGEITLRSDFSIVFTVRVSFHS